MPLVIQSCSSGELCATFGKSEKLLIELRGSFEEWLKLQPHLPQDAPPQVLDYFLLGTKLSLERAKQKLDMFYTMKRLMPELFTGHDPRSSNFNHLHKLVQTVCLPKLTPRKERVFIMRPNYGDYSQITGYDCFKYLGVMEKILVLEAHHSLGSIYVFDHSSITLSFLALFTPVLIKRSEVAMTVALAKRIAGVHFVNAAPITKNMVALGKKVLKPKLVSRIHSHSKGNYESLHEHIPKSILPKDYGGDESSIAHLAELWRNKIDENRDWIKEQEKNLVNESLRPGPSMNGDDLFGTAGSFRKMDVD